MKTILVLITSSPFSTANCLSGFHYCEAALDAGHRVNVFFYGDGVLNSNAFNSPSSDEINLRHRWQALTKNNDLQLIVCNTAANRRGIQSEEDSPERFNWLNILWLAVCLNLPY